MIRFGPARDEPHEMFRCPHCGLLWSTEEERDEHAEEDHQ